MNLEQFKKLVNVLSEKEANELKKIYISKFVDSSKEYYIKYIKDLHEYSDGLCYTGYLWDCLKFPSVIDFQYIESQGDVLNEVFVFWDMHTRERIFIEDYWKFEKNSVLKLGFKELLYGLKYLPEDIYIFDKTFEWTLIPTHEYIGDKRWCLKAGNI